MNQGILWKLAVRLSPGLDKLEPPQQVFSYIAVAIVLLHLPLAILALAWLTVETHLSRIADAPILYALLLAVLLLMEQNSFFLYIELSNGDLVSATGSIGSIVSLSAALIYGPTALWLTVCMIVFSTSKTAWRLHQSRQPVMWSSLSTLIQGFGRDILAALVGLAVFSTLGGRYPLKGLATGDWLPALIGISSCTAVEMTLLILFMVYLNRQITRIGQSMYLTGLLRMAVILATLSIPFPILGALIDSEASRGLYLLFIVGVVLVNYLAHNLSRTVERSQQRARELAQLETLGEALIQAPPDLSTLPHLLEEHASRMFPQDRVEINLYDPDEHDLPRFHIRTAPQRPPAEKTVWDRLRQSVEPYLIDTNVVLSGTTLHGSALSVKILADNPGEEGGEKEHFLGGIHLTRARMVGKVTTSLPAAQALASQIGSAYYRAQVHQASVTAQKMAQELELAGRIQSKFLPTTIPAVPGWDIAAGLVPARQTSGDFYDFIPLNAGCLGLVVADVADKGTGAALFMALSRTLLRTYAMQFPENPAAAIQATNARILTDAESDQFVTVFYGVLDPATGNLSYVNAGHNPVFVVDGADEPRSLGKTGIPLGLFDHVPWKQATIQIAPGETLVAYTDGVSEAHNPASEEFGEQRLLDVIRSCRDQPAAALHTALMEAVRGFVGSAPQFDDITLMVVKRQL